MEKLSDHTKLMNIIMGLALKIPEWPHPLRDTGYTIEIIEANLPEINPDLILTTRRYNHSIICDCKSKTIKEEQTQKYLSIRTDPEILIRRGIVDVPVSQHYKADPAYVSFSDISTHPLITDNRMPFLHAVEIDNKVQRIDSKGANFQIDMLNNIFPIEISGIVPPYNLYPFDVEDQEIFTIHILRELLIIGIRQQSFTVEELLNSTHKYWSIISSHKKKIFKNKANKIICDLEGSELKSYLQRDGDSWKIIIKQDAKSIQAFQRRGNEAIESLRSKLEQATLGEFQNESN